MDPSNQSPNEDNQLESLENEQAPTENSGASSNDGGTVHSEPLQTIDTTATQAHVEHHPLRSRFQHVNLYLLTFFVLLLVAGAVTGYLYLDSKQTKQQTETLSSQSLSSSSLSQLANSGVSVGDPKQILNVQSNSIFSGKVLVREDLEVAGHLLVGSSLSLTGITVGGQSKFDDVQVTKDLAVSGNAGIQGKMSVRNLAATGDGNFGGTVTATQLVANTLQLNNNLTLTHHLIAGGSTPSRSNGSGLGSGGTSTVSGSDTSGSITINTGSNPAAGCFITVNFTQRYNSVPHVLITPVNAGAAQVNYYVTRTTSNFSVCGVNAAPGQQTFGYDYMVIE